jgi:hypothetical protein
MEFRLRLGALAGLAAMVAGLASTAALAAPVPDCPPNIAVTQAASGPVPAGWTSFTARRAHPFAGVSFMSGSPDAAGAMAPSNEKRKGRKLTATWEFPSTDATYWLVCEYAGTSVVMAQPLGKEVASCTVEYNTAVSTRVAQRWQCSERPA